MDKERMEELRERRQKLLEMAVQAENAVFFHCDASLGVLMVDCYIVKAWETFQHRGAGR